MSQNDSCFHCYTVTLASSQLKDDDVSKLGQNYDIITPPSRCPKVKVIEFADDMDDETV